MPRQPEAQRWRSVSLHVSFARLAELEVADRTQSRIAAEVHQRAVDPDALRTGVRAERIGIPEHDVRHLPDLQATRLVGNSQSLGRIVAEPGPGMLVAEVEAHPASVRESLGRFLVQALNS